MRKCYNLIKSFSKVKNQNVEELNSRGIVYEEKYIEDVDRISGNIL